MQDENQDAGSRVRHVPIRVEQRNTPRSNQRQRDDQVNYQNGAYKNHHRHGDNHHPDFYSSGHASPETSSINISHKPSPPARTTTYHNTSANNIYCNDSAELNAEYERRFNNATPTQGQDKERERSRSKHGSTTSPASNSDKLVSSPEPIPLPPPPTEQHFRADSDSNLGHSHEATDQKKPKKNDSVSDKINLIKAELSQYLQAIVNFNGISSQSKDYRYLDEMLDRCVINLDNIMVGESSDLRQQRKAVINLVDKASSILAKKVEINKDIHDLSEYMTISS